MKTELSARYKDTPDGEAAASIMLKCVHCGLCNATCPTYQLLGDELDGPRGRIYLVKQLLEGHEVTGTTQLHLDRCLTCRACETTCPSGVEFGRLVDIGRKLVEQRVERPAGSRAWRWVLKEGLTSAWFAPALRVGQALRALLPQFVRSKIPLRRAAVRPSPATATLRRRVLVLEGCVQPALAPNINRATARVLAAAGIEAVSIAEAGCCGAIRQHLNDHDGALRHMRRNIDAWWPAIANGSVEAIIINSSACTLSVKDYCRALKEDPAYAARAARVSALTRDLSEMLADLAPLLKDKVQKSAALRVAFHPPCTLQHGQKLSGLVETHLTALGFEVRIAAEESHLCCGSAGTYSVLQPELAGRLRDRKLRNLAALQPDCIVSANIGCILHLQSGTTTPVRHWVEVLDEALCGHGPQEA
jgi:glycolate dehydrogenase iron-sulfur subunit